MFDGTHQVGDRLKQVEVTYVIADRDKPIVSVLRLLPDCDRVTRSDEKGFKATSRR